jgi:hypothetical protein
MLEEEIADSKLTKNTGDVCIFPQLVCCPSLRSLREEGVAIPLIANQHLLSSAMLRQGLGKRFSSAIWPSAIWHKFNDPIKTVLLQAAEVAAGTICHPLYPTIPTRAIARELQEAVQEVKESADWLMSASGNGDELDDVDVTEEPNGVTHDYQTEQEDVSEISANEQEVLVDFDIDRYERPLKQLGLHDACYQYMEGDDLRVNEASRHCLDAINEYCTLLYSDNPQTSLHIQNILDLYPLHKRVLGLVEYMILPRLEKRGLRGNASAIWTQAFTGEIDNNNGRQRTPGLSTASWPLWPDKLATLEPEGNWLLHAVDHEAADRSGPIDLATLLDGIVARMTSAGEVTGVSVSLHQPTPQIHARQLAVLADRSSDSAACMTLYLGKIALMLRNAVEHGTDRVGREGLLLETSGYWTEERGPRNNRLPVFDWLRATAAQVSWRSSTSLPTRFPSAANMFLLTPVSLQRCLTLLSLVMHGASSQLQIWKSPVKRKGSREKSREEGRDL